MENMEINCEKIVEEYLLNKNPLYTFSFPLALLIAIVIFGISKAGKWSENSYINQILIPILAFLGTMVLIDIISRAMISGQERNILIKKCKIWMHDESVKSNPLLNKIIDMNAVINYNEDAAIEKFTIQDNNIDNNAKYNKSIRNIESIRDMQKVIDMTAREQRNNYKETIQVPISEIPNISPYPIKLEEPINYEKCVGGNSQGVFLCSGPDTQENPMHYPVPGPQWLPQSAHTVQTRLANNDYW